MTLQVKPQPHNCLCSNAQEQRSATAVPEAGSRPKGGKARNHLLTLRLLVLFWKLTANFQYPARLLSGLDLKRWTISYC
jgi:hypothetical protein